MRGEDQATVLHQSLTRWVLRGATTFKGKLTGQVQAEQQTLVPSQEELHQLLLVVGSPQT